jgi:hypothetical protein
LAKIAKRILMVFDVQLAKKKLKWLYLSNVLAWALTVGLFIFPAYQWWQLGHVPVDTTFVVLMGANIVSLVLSAKIATRVKFANYQIRYFSTHEEDQNG